MSILPSECEQLLISGYVLGNLSPAEALLFAEMLTENPDLISQVAAMQEALDSAYAPPEVTPNPTLRERILTTANAQTVDAEVAKPSSTEISKNLTSSKIKFSWNKIFGAIALAAITTLGITNYRLWQTVRTAQTNTPSDHQLTYSLRSEDPTQASTAKLIVKPDNLDASLVAKNLPSLPPEKVYALWTVVGKEIPYTTDEKGAILTAVFQVNESGDFKQEIVVPQPHLEPRTIQKIAITVEDISAPQAHQGSIFISTGN